MFTAHPLKIDHRGRTAEVSQTKYVRQLIEQVLFTLPGERVNRPDFGGGLTKWVFSSVQDEVVTANKFLLQSALQNWLGDLIQIESVDVNSNEEYLLVTVRYLNLKTQERINEQFKR